MSLVKAATAGDRAMVRKTVEALAAEERAKKHMVLAEQLEKHIQSNGTPPRAEVLPIRGPSQPEVLVEITPRKTLSDIVLTAGNRQLVEEFVQEHHRSDLLRSYNLRPRNRILLTGSPGNGKTSLAEALANAIMVPLVVARYDALITSFLGETASRLRRLFEYSHTRQCVLFFDEFDTLGKERGDIHETGEIKRVVSSLLLQIDDLPSHVTVVCATNHPELLDRAVWRRFQIRMELDSPSTGQIEEFLASLASRMNLKLGAQLRTVARRLTGANFSEVEDFMTDVARSYVLSLPSGDATSILTGKLQRWKSRSGAQAANRPKQKR